MAALFTLGLTAGCGGESSGGAGGEGGSDSNGGSGGSSGKGGKGGSNQGGSGGESEGGSGGSGSGGSGSGGSGAGGKGGGGGAAAGGKGGSSSGGAGGSSSGGAGGTPPATCGGDVAEATAEALSFTGNQIASPAPPGGLTPATAPQIVVFGWDDVESSAGIAFVNQLIGSVTNPNGAKGGTNLNPNACYLQSPQYPCGDGSLGWDRAGVTANKYDFGNHTIDHLESWQATPWSGIPPEWKATDSGANSGWKFTADGFGPGIGMDSATWQKILRVNDMELKSLLPGIAVTGFRAPRLEVNDQGLQAIKALGYTYDQDLEEVLPESYTDAAVAVDTAAKKGFNWVPWPYTLDNGSPGIWNQQAFGDKKYILNYPTGVWEVPVYMLYVPSKGGLGKTIADAMLAADKDCVFPASVPKDQQKHCFLSDGELAPGAVVKDVTAFDFNTFIYSRMKKQQWVDTMKHTFLTRFYGNRAPLTYGAHPIEYTAPYDSYTLMTQENNYGYRNVLKYNTFTDRQAAMTEFVNWIKNDPVLSKETYFLSAKQMVDFMKAPYDKAGKPAPADTVATPDSNALFTRLTWKGVNSTIKAVDGNTADIVFTVPNADASVYVVAGVKAGSLKGVSHIDLKYNSDVPFRIRLGTDDPNLTRTILLAGTGSDRLARIRVKDFSPPEEEGPEAVGAATLVDAAFMEKVNGISFEAAATPVSGYKAFNTHIKQLTLHGVASAALCGQ